MEKASESSAALGNRLKQLRQRNGLSQREMGRQAGVTNSNISMIEQGLISPSITSLERLLAVIPMSLEQFFSWNPETAEGQVFRSDSIGTTPGSDSGLQVQTLPPGGLSFAGVAPPILERRFLAPGSDTGSQFRKEPHALIAWLLEGELELSMGARVFSLASDDGFYLPAQQVYRLRNLARVGAHLVWARASAQ